MAVMKYGPTPGHEKMVSVMMAPVTSSGMAMPRRVTTGTRTLRHTCLNMICTRLAPKACWTCT